MAALSSKPASLLDPNEVFTDTQNLFTQESRPTLGDKHEDDDDFNDDDELIFSLNKSQRTLALTHQPLPQYTSDKHFENLDEIIEFISKKGKSNAKDYTKQIDELWKALGDLEERARALLTKRKRLRKRITEIEDVRDVFEKDPDRLYEGLFDSKPPFGKYDIRGISGGSRVSALLASDTELSDFEPISSKKSSFLVLKLENQIQGINSQLRMLQDNLAFTEKALEKTHLATRHCLVSLIKLFRSPKDHDLSAHLDLEPKDTLAYFAGLVVTLLKTTRANYEIDNPIVRPHYASCVMKRDDIPHTYVQMRNSSDLTHNKHILTDLVCLMAGQCFKLGTKRGLCFLTEKRELVTKEAKGYLDDFKRRGIEVIIIFVEDLLDELPSEAKSVCKFIEELPDCIKLFTDDH
ncbi:uncharacterized protein LOC142336849 [Convolutriloba macropyga]|uniref:uncharacterized protein LOC142336849 n=1 Tax=Convolutriloba macropyga TaxID=536237 RepID=UPI003F521678